MKVTVVNDQNRVVTSDDGNVVVVQAGNTVTVEDVGPQGPAGTGADGYILQAYDVTDQTAASVTTAYPVKIGTTDISDGITVTNNGSGDPTRITFDNDGNYNIQFSIQFANSSASEAQANVWFRKNDVDIADSNSQVTVPKKHGAGDGTLILALNFVVNLGTGDYVEIYWQTESTDVSIQYLPAGTTPTTPATPSVIVTATVVRYLEVGPAGPGVPTGGTTGQYLRKTSSTNYDTAWATLPNDLPTAGTTGQMLVKNSATNYDAAWVTGGLRFIKNINIGTGVSTVVVSDVFSSTYSNYRILITDPVGSIVYQTQVNIRLGAMTNNGYGGFLWTANAQGLNGVYSGGNTSTVPLFHAFNGAGTQVSFDIHNPYASTATSWSGTTSNGARFAFIGGQHLGTTSFTSFTLSTSSGTISGGIIQIYGYCQ